MDSVSNGSMQSSSAGDEEYDSRADTISAFVSNQPYQLPQHHAHSFDSLSNYLDLQRSSSSVANPDALLNLDMIPSKLLIRSDPFHGFGALIASSSSGQNPTPFQSQMATGQTGGTGSAAFSNRRQALLPVEGASSRFSVSASTDQRPDSRITADNNNVVRNLKKRSRASRRAPTTVLTTDTANFRAMVQEFTGIPAPPFTSSHFPRSRLHFIGTASSTQPVPSYLTRPFVQKVQSLPHPFVTSSSSPAVPSFLTSAMLVDSLVTNTTSSATHSNSIDCHLSSDYGLLKASRNLHNVNMHTNPILSFQYSLQTAPEFRLGASSPIGARDSRPDQGQGSMGVNQLSTADPALELGGEFEQFGLGQGHINTNQIGLQAMVNSPSKVIALSGSGINNPSTTVGNARVIDHDDGEPGLIFRSSLSGNLSNSCNVNCSTSTPDFHGEKGPDGVPAARTEGMVESWINCSSDLQHP